MHTSFGTVVSVVALLTVSTSTRNAYGSSVVVEAPVRISPPAAGPHFYWTLAASSTDSRHLVACSVRNRPERNAATHSVLYGSDDGGTSWRKLYADDDALLSSESSCALGSKGRIYFISSRVDEEGKAASFPPGLLANIDHGTAIRRSEDFGEHWESAAVAYSAENLLAVIAGPNTDQLVVFASGARPKVVPSTIVSEDGGKTFGQWVPFTPSPRLPVNVDTSNTTRKENDWMGRTLVLPDKSLGAVFWDHFQLDDQKDAAITWARFDANGLASGAPVTVAMLSSATPVAGRADNYLRSSARGREFHYPSAAVGSVPGSGARRIYVVWHDVIGKRVRVILSRSDDYGVTWSPPRPVDDGPQRQSASDNIEPLLPSVEVNASGIVGLLWSEHEGRCWRFAASRDGGDSFEKSVEVNACERRPTPFNTLLRESLSTVFPLETVNPQGKISVVDWREWAAGFRRIALVATPDSVFHAAWSPFAQDDDP
jgi:hypothetical protein